ncbi:DNA repair protein RecN [Psychrobium sp. 1_MG-2023]|uniref:DNA repair protein RecN n=1 Tax=Psychrobium sp. 1_MG-2023 TaxID=3062624 RepID=UPI000C34A60F|nr:DNA repair protein RecN [Psychrobium sp. 1_MG-2023]MDP2561248.1 DNA repair protein RecN [Psychrobium sp. 1_MG-2023]PKF55250.1 DNA repair protein RecN [Alteromonadales bacterium alter-6D02]
MLTQLSINDFAIVEHLDIELNSGMTTITGETGAGKSIAIDGLSLCLGARAEASMVRPTGQRADICATFNIETNSAALKFLSHSELDNANECIVRRTISSEGRSKGYINGRAVPVSQLKELGKYLLNIHGQHAHQGLLDSSLQLTLLDQYAGHKSLLSRVELTFKNVQAIRQELNQLIANQQQYAAKVQLLEYQVEELDTFALVEGEFEQIEQEHQRLSNSETLQYQSHQLLDQLADSEHNIEASLHSAVATLEQLLAQDSSLSECTEMLQGALIQVQESVNEVRHYNENIEQDPQRLQEVEQRLSKAMQLARKHHVEACELPSLHQSMHTELANLSGCELRITELEQQLKEIEKQYYIDAEKLSESRKKFAKKLDKLIAKSLRRLAMEHSQFEISISPNSTQTLSKYGVDLVEFKVSTNPGQPLEPLHKVVSGGELSRISLAISVITAQKVATPTLIFDEVDVGISGPTAATVGAMLRELGESTQILCVTHLPQVAGCGHQQMQVIKQTDGKSTHTTMSPLKQEERVIELARLLGGNKISDATLANANELLVAN